MGIWVKQSLSLELAYTLHQNSTLTVQSGTQDIHTGIYRTEKTHEETHVQYP